MGICPELVSLIQDVIYSCNTHVHINSAYSTPYSLVHGICQGNPLSCLLYDFSIMPMGMRLCNVISSISMLGLPPAKIIMYTDDTNLFLSSNEDLPLICKELSISSLAIGSKFNFEKTDVIIIGSEGHRSLPTHDPITTCFSGAYIIPNSSPLHILGVWIGSPNFAQACRMSFMEIFILFFNPILSC